MSAVGLFLQVSSLLLFLKIPVSVLLSGSHDDDDELSPSELFLLDSIVTAPEDNRLPCLHPGFFGVTAITVCIDFLHSAVPLCVPTPLAVEELLPPLPVHAATGIRVDLGGATEQLDIFNPKVGS